jgi:hypothetical protein
MKIYVFECPECGHTSSQTSPIPRLCPACAVWGKLAVMRRSLLDRFINFVMGTIVVLAGLMLIRLTVQWLTGN